MTDTEFEVENQIEKDQIIQTLKGFDKVFTWDEKNFPCLIDFSNQEIIEISLQLYKMSCVFADRLDVAASKIAYEIDLINEVTSGFYSNNFSYKLQEPDVSFSDKNAVSVLRYYRGELEADKNGNDTIMIPFHYFTSNTWQDELKESVKKEKELAKLKLEEKNKAEVERLLKVQEEKEYADYLRLKEKFGNNS